ncbi:hypothetical protein DYD21_15705 [Rhodohalobacter sp. SW132]|nr:hypothetical protein DYD21_15705 [Rhodohalobacter sp. SW132]
MSYLLCRIGLWVTHLISLYGQNPSVCTPFIGNLLERVNCFWRDFFMDFLGEISCAVYDVSKECAPVSTSGLFGSANRVMQEISSTHLSTDLSF